jgi:carbamoyltransferase
MSVILGINAFHPDSAACLLVDGELKAAVAEERVGLRIKHNPAFPSSAIRQVLADAGVRLRDVTHVALARDTRANLVAKARYSVANPRRSAGAILEHLSRARGTSSVLSHLPALLGEPDSSARFKLVPVEHHLAHIASAYYCSPFESVTAGFSYDASGDFASMMAARCEGNQIQILDRVTLPNSLGIFYTAVCQFIGFDAFGEEYKVMGLAPYGEDKYAQVMSELLHLESAGWFSIDRTRFGMHLDQPINAVDQEDRILIGTLYHPSWSDQLGEPRKRANPITQREKDLARSCQARFETAAVHCFNRLQSLVPTSRVAYAGGCALNGVANARILRDAAFSNAFLQSAASDDGTCLGAALWAYHNVAGGTHRFTMRHAFWGPDYSEGRQRSAIQSTAMPFRTLDQRSALLDSVAAMIERGLVVGWFQGRSEWGPRALGNRSILANPTLPTMKDVINQKIKRRESFRPFAPSVLREHVSTYFEQDVESPFMMHVVKFRPEWRDKLPAVVHVDGTGRLQSVDRESNGLYYDLISAFARRTGVHMVLNTSFNENEPIVDTPEQAVDCFLRTDMDALVVGPHVVTKPGIVAS